MQSIETTAAGLPGAPKPRRLTHRQAAQLLAERDPIISRLVVAAGLPSFRPPQDSHFAALVRSVTYQQLAGAAALAIHTRLVLTLDGDVSPERLLGTATERLRGAGLSTNKVLCLQDLAAKVVDGTVALDRRSLARASDEAIIDRLCTVRGIGRWSAQMFLMFQLRRLDVWPTGDLGVRKGFGLAWNIAMPTPKQLDVLGAGFEPYRSVVAWYCWRATELYAGASASAVTR